jgi:pantothenate kinase
MNINGQEIEIQSRPEKVYVVRISYLKNQMFGDPTDDRIIEETATLYQYEVSASSMKLAIEKAMTIDKVVQAEQLANWPMIMPDEMVNKDSIQSFYNYLEQQGMFSAWMTIDPTSVQCTLKEDFEFMETMTENNVMEKAKNMPKDIQDFLNKEK